MVFALETFWPASDGWSAARIEEQLVVTADGCEVITRFPAEELLVAAGEASTRSRGALPGMRETKSNLNNPSHRAGSRRVGARRRRARGLMPTEVIMPALGMAQETGKVVRWLKAEGDAVAKGEPLLEVETDKVTVEIEAPADGTLAGIRAAEGVEVPVGHVIAYVLATGEPLAEAPAAAAASRPRSPCRCPPATASRSSGGRPRRRLASPKARRLAPSAASTSPASSGAGRAARSSPPTSRHSRVPVVRPEGRRFGLAGDGRADAAGWQEVPQFVLCGARSTRRGSGAGVTRRREAGLRAA